MPEPTYLIEPGHPRVSREIYTTYLYEDWRRLGHPNQAKIVESKAPLVDAGEDDVSAVRQ